MWSGVCNWRYDVMRQSAQKGIKARLSACLSISKLKKMYLRVNFQGGGIR